jgi:hypothetical protein
MRRAGSSMLVETKSATPTAIVETETPKSIVVQAYVPEGATGAAIVNALRRGEPGTAQTPFQLSFP